MNQVISTILKKIADIVDLPMGAYNVRVDGQSVGRNSTDTITIVPKEDKAGIDIYIKPGAKNETVYIPVVVSSSGLNDVVYNDFYIGKDCDVTIIAGCGIHNDGACNSQHDGIHVFHVGEDAKVKYVEKHYGEGEGSGKRVLNPVTEINMEKGSYLEMETVQISGVDSTYRLSKGKVAADATLIIKEKLLTDGKQTARTEFEIDLDGVRSSANLISRSVARGSSKQEFYSKMNGNNECSGHSECDAIIMDRAVVTAIPVVTANHVEATLIHEAAIGKIAGEQIIKLMTLGLTPEQAEQEIVTGFLN